MIIRLSLRSFMPRNLDQEFANAERQAEQVLMLSATIGALPADQRRTLVFQALALAERGNGGVAVRRGPGRPPKSSNVKTFKAPSKGRGAGGPFDKIVDALRTSPGMEINKLAKLAYGVANEKTERKTYSALQSMKGTRVKRLPKRGEWAAL
jgi:hypothetical protein